MSDIRKPPYSRSCTMSVDKLVAWQRTGVFNGRIYTKQQTRDMEQLIAKRWIQIYGYDMAEYTGPVVLNMRVYRELPKSAAKRRIGEHDISKPDGDNLLKLIGDALNEVAWHDDSQVVVSRVVKMPRNPHGSGCAYVIESTTPRKRAGVNEMVTRLPDRAAWTTDVAFETKGHQEDGRALSSPT